MYNRKTVNNEDTEINPNEYYNSSNNIENHNNPEHNNPENNNPENNGSSTVYIF